MINIIFFSDYQRNEKYKKYNLERRYYSCRYIYIIWFILFYSELKKIESIYDDKCRIDSQPSNIITIYKEYIDIPYTYFFMKSELVRNGIYSYI